MSPAVFFFLASLGSGAVVHDAAVQDQPAFRRPAFCAAIPSGAVILVRFVVGKDGQAASDIVPQVLGADPAELEEAELRAVAAVRSALPFKDWPAEAANRSVAIKFDLDRVCGGA
jgi:hypothetical protein